MTVIDISKRMQVRLSEWYRLGNKLDVKLLFECAYYPRGGCNDCSWDYPNGNCKRAHILIDTRIDGGGHLRVKGGGRKKDSLERVLLKLPKEARDEIQMILKGGVG